ncbi:MAG TPA: AAA family ATPase, partial [Albitalea sp.]|nr:AAA family ATPase [Albitalea sp.]
LIIDEAQNLSPDVLEQLRLLTNLETNERKLLQSVCEEFGIPAPKPLRGEPTVKDYLDPLNQFLLKTHAVGQNNLLIIDEAQNLSPDVLEQLRLLTNLETNERKLLQIILIGQPELRTMLARPELEQLAQRVIARFHLEALSPGETARYIRHRLQVAGLTKAMPFDRRARKRIQQLSRGVPRRINLLCDRALLGAYATGRDSVDRQIVDKAAIEVFDQAEFATPPPSRHGRTAMLGLALAAGATLFGVLALSTDSGPHRTTSAAGKPAPLPASAAAPASAPVVAVAASAAASTPAAFAPADLPLRFTTLLRNERDAWRELAPAWGLTALTSADGDPCQAAERQQVACFRSNAATLALIRQLGRPGIVTLNDEAGKPVYALLTALTAQSATLRMGSVSQTMTLPSLAQMWRGDFATFWRAPPGYANQIVDASAGPAADWLQSRLTTLQGEARAGDKRSPADALKARVYAFQLAQGLKADGLAGPTTFMQLNRATGVDEPRLVQN